jgi:hypothetical protein
LVVVVVCIVLSPTGNPKSASIYDVIFNSVRVLPGALHVHTWGKRLEPWLREDANQRLKEAMGLCGSVRVS